jgi:hypothetical protein
VRRKGFMAFVGLLGSLSRRDTAVRQFTPYPLRQLPLAVIREEGQFSACRNRRSECLRERRGRADQERP